MARTSDKEKMLAGELYRSMVPELVAERAVAQRTLAQYNATDGVRGPANYLSLLVSRASMTGMVVFDFAARYGEAAGEIAGWMREGRLISREDVVEGGVSAFPAALLKLFAGEKQLWGKPSNWCDYSGTIGDEKVGVAMLDHPDNPRHIGIGCRTNHLERGVTGK